MGVYRAQEQSFAMIENVIIRRIIISFAVLALSVSIINNINLCNIFVVNIWVGLIISIAIFDIFEWKLYGGNLKLSFIGRNSMVIYLIHSYILTVLRVLFDKLNIGYVLVILTVGMLLGVGGPILFAKFSKKCGFYNYLFSIKAVKNSNYV